MASEKTENLKLIHIVAFVSVVIGLMWVYQPESNTDLPSSGHGSEIVEAFDWEAEAEARAAAVAYAGAVRLARVGTNVEAMELISADTSDGDDYKITYRNADQTITLFAERQCDRLDMEKLQRPNCWVWR